MEKVDVIIPAGGSIDESFAKIADTPHKALVAFQGKSVVETTVAALAASGRTNRMVVIGPPELEKNPAIAKATEFLPEGKTGPENIFRGLDWLQHQPDAPSQVLIVTCDLPFLTGDVINRYLDMCPAGKDFCVPLVSKDSYLELYPGADATFVRLKDGTWTTGCAYLVSAKGLQASMHHITSVFEQRKSKIGMARLLGLGFVFKMLTKQLEVPAVEKKVEELLGVAAAAVPDSPAELAYDIDFLDDYYYALNNLKAHPRSV